MTLIKNNTPKENYTNEDVLSQEELLKWWPSKRLNELPKNTDVPQSETA
jgi:hypothetical protein